MEGSGDAKSKGKACTQRESRHKATHLHALVKDNVLILFAALHFRASSPPEGRQLELRVVDVLVHELLIATISARIVVVGHGMLCNCQHTHTKMFLACFVVATGRPHCPTVQCFGSSRRFHGRKNVYLF